MTKWPHRADDFTPTTSGLLTQRNVCSRKVWRELDPPASSPVCEKPRGAKRTNLPLFLSKGSGIIQTRWRMFAGRLSFICGANADEEVVSGRSTTLWRVFIRYCNLRLLQGRGQRWLLFTPHFMARKIIDPHKVHLVHMEVGTAFVARDAVQPLIRTVRTEAGLMFSFSFWRRWNWNFDVFIWFRLKYTMWQSHALSDPGYQWVCCLGTLSLSVIMPVQPPPLPSRTALCPSQAVIRYSGPIVEQTTRGSPAAQEYSFSRQMMMSPLPCDRARFHCQINYSQRLIGSAESRSLKGSFSSNSSRK